MNPPVFQPDGTTRTFAVLGHPVSHSLSPAMHNPALRQMGVNGVYLAYDVRPDALLEVLTAMSKMGWGGCNLTIPHKEVAFRGLDHLDDTARLAGSANTILFRPDGTMEGYSTDGYGLRMALNESFGLSFTGSDVLILGCGGAGRAAAIQAAQEGASCVRLANRSPERRMILAEEIRKAYPDVEVEELCSWPPPADSVHRSEIILQSTSLGMKADEPPLLDQDAFHQGQAFLDMTYIQQKTPTMLAAELAGARVVNGLGMLLHQGVRSLEIWTGQEVPVETMRAALRAGVYGEDAYV